MSQDSSKQKKFNFSNRSKGGFHRGKGNRNNHFQKSGPKKDRPKAAQLCEQDVGITEYMRKEPGFSGIIKARFSDFHVNEIDCEGSVAKLTNTDIPEHFNQECTDAIDERPLVIPEEVWQQVKLLSENESNDEVISLEITSLSKGERTAVHEAVKRCFDSKIVANTVTKEDKKYVEFRKYNKFTNDDRRMQWPKHIPQFVHFLMYKESLDTMEACYKVADCLRMKVDNFAYAGVKDKRAKTTQWVSVRKVPPEKLLKRTKPMRNVKIGNICFKNKPLKLGKLKGNRFRIALRNVTADDDTINRAMESLNVNGFINYYGMQRFGNDKEVPTFLIGVKLLQGNFKEACDLILKLKVSDDPDSDITAAKKVYNQTGDAKKACEKFGWNRNKCLEYKLLEGLSKHAANDYVNSLENIPRSTRMLYIHSFQSLVWNKIVSKRIKEFGLQPIVGDLVLLDKDQLEQGDAEATQSEDVEVYFVHNTTIISHVTASSDVLKGDAPKADAVKVLCEEDLGKYSLYDIVLPLPGFDIKYPDNKVKDWYKEILQEYGLELEMPKQKVSTYSLSGKYRNIIEKVINLSWYTLQYNDPNCNLIRSDYEELKGEKEPKSVPGGQYKALIIDMCLRSAIYATMVLREVLKIDTSCASQTKLNDYHVNVKDKADATSSNKSVKSLLDSPDKFALFKRMVFDDDNDLKRKNEDEIDGGDTKKLKTEEGDKEGKQTIVADVI